MRSDPEWREFEKLVAQIEEDLAPKGAVVTSPDRLRDLVTGQLREVDASIRFQIGSSPILITVECRDRQDVQDDTWIEQLASKRMKVGADKTIAVSSSGFTGPAKKTAALHGIELRTLEDRIGEEIVQRFFSGLRVQMIVDEYEAKTVAFELEDGSALEPTQFGEELVAALEGEGGHAVLATEVATGRVVTADGLLRSRMQEALAAGPSVQGVVRVEFKAGAFQVSTVDGPKYLKSIEIEAEFRQREVPMPPTSLWEYSSDEGAIRRKMQATAAISEEEEVLLTVDLDSPALDRQTEIEGDEEE